MIDEKHKQHEQFSVISHQHCFLLIRGCQSSLHNDYICSSSCQVDLIPCLFHTNKQQTNEFLFILSGCSPGILPFSLAFALVHHLCQLISPYQRSPWCLTACTVTIKPRASNTTALAYFLMTYVVYCSKTWLFVVPLDQGI